MADSTIQLDFGAAPLDVVAARVLGALVEKEFTTPDNYPLSLNALTAACNQTSNREPVMALNEDEVSQGLQELLRRTLAREVHRSDSRVRKFRHALKDTLSLHPAELATLCVLLLRGAQTPGEIKGRTGRMFEFIDLAHVEITLQALMNNVSVPLVMQLERQPGQKEVRYAHLLAGEPQVQQVSTPTTPAPAGVAARLEALEQEVATLREALEDLRERYEAFRGQF